MKKILVFFAIVLMSSFVLAQGKGIHESGTGIEDPELKGTGQGLANGAEQGKGVMNQTGPVMMQEGVQVHAGLYNALQNVKNENARAALQRNMERFLEKYQARLENMEGLEVEEVDEETGDATLVGKEPVKWFGFIKGKATKRFEVSNGKINEKAPWYSFLYAEESSE